MKKNVLRGALSFMLAATIAISPLSAMTVAARDNSFEPFHEDANPWAAERDVDKSVYMDPAQPIEVRVEALLSQMTLREKAGQTTQLTNGTNLGSVGTANGGHVRNYFLGSYLYAGGGVPGNGFGGNTTEGWIHYYNVVQNEAVNRTPLGIPILVEIDAVHGTGHAPGTTIFPHNIGLGSAVWADYTSAGTTNYDLARDIGVATAYEMSALGYHFTFSPCIPLAMNARWGRTSEGFGHDPVYEGEIAAAIVEGYQGGRPAQWDALNTSGTPNQYAYMASEIAMGATMKHFIGEGLTVNGDNQGQFWINEREDSATPWPIARTRNAQGNPTGTYDFRGVYDLINMPVSKWMADPIIQDMVEPYRALTEAGARSFMPTFNNVNGMRAHQLKSMYDIIKLPKSQGGLGFTGFVVGDYNGHSTTGIYAPSGNELVNAARHFYGEDKGLHGEFNWNGSTITSQQFRNGLVTNAGMDLMMVVNASEVTPFNPNVPNPNYNANGWFATTIMNTMSGRTPVERLDDAVRRILRVKFELGLFDNPFPAMGLSAAQMAEFGLISEGSRTSNAAYRTALLAAVEKQSGKLRDQNTDIYISKDIDGNTFKSTTELAREAARRSFVLLKNDVTRDGESTIMQDLLDVDGDKVLIAGRFASRLGWQLGDWVHAWQGVVSPWLGHHNPGFFYQGTTMITAMEQVFAGSFNRNRQFSEYGTHIAGFEPEVIILSVGETPYSEGQGDARIAGTVRNNDDFSRGHSETLQLHPEDHMILRNVQAAYPDTPIVLVGFFGRSMVLADIVNDVDAIISAWWPGTEGGLAVVEMLFTDKYEFTGRTSFPWTWYPEWLGDNAPEKQMWNIGAGLNRNQSSNALTPNTFVRPARQTTPIVIAEDAVAISGTIYTHNASTNVRNDIQPVYDKGGYLASTLIRTGGVLPIPNPQREVGPFATGSGFGGTTPPIANRIEVSFFARENAWVEYLIDVKETGAYNIGFSNAKDGGTAQNAVRLYTRAVGSDRDDASALRLLQTYNAQQNIPAKAVYLEEGVQVLRLDMDPTATALTVSAINISKRPDGEFSYGISLDPGSLAAGHDAFVTVTSDVPATYFARLMNGDAEVARAYFTGGVPTARTARLAIPKTGVENVGTYQVSVVSAAGTAIATDDISILAYTQEIWRMALEGRSNQIHGIFNWNIVTSNAVVSVTRNGEPAVSVVTGAPLSSTASVSGANEVLVTGFQTDDLAVGDVITISGIKFPTLFPDYSFTFTAVWRP